MKKRTDDIDHGITDIIDFFLRWHKLPEGVLMLGIGCLGFFPWDRAAQIR